MISSIRCWVWYRSSIVLERLKSFQLSIMRVLNGVTLFSGYPSYKSWKVNHRQIAVSKTKTGKDMDMCLNGKFCWKLIFCLLFYEILPVISTMKSFFPSNEVIILSSGKNYLFQVLKAILNSMLLSYWKAGIAKLRCNNWSSSLSHLNQLKMFVSCFCS